MNEHELDDLLSTPRPETEAALESCPGDIVILGAGGKIGPTLAQMAKRAGGANRRIIAVSRWTSPATERALKEAGVETVHADLLDRKAIDGLPDAPNVIFMAGQKFGTTSKPGLTWAMNTVVPAYCAERYRESRIVVFSSGNVYALAPVSTDGSRETDAPAPIGDYAGSCVGRERIFEFYAERHKTRVAIIRLNYAIDLRYGVLLDIATRVRRGEQLALHMGYVNVIWQGDSNRIALECLPHATTPPYVVNVTGGERLAVREVAKWFARRFRTDPKFTGRERTDSLLSSTNKMRSTFAAPEVGSEQMFEWVAEWVENGGATFGKPTSFEERDGRF